MMGTVEISRLDGKYQQQQLEKKWHVDSDNV